MAMTRSVSNKFNSLSTKVLLDRELEMAQRSAISLSQKQVLVKRFQEGMTCVNKGNLLVREAVARAGH